jgi:hypothetical protein
LIHFEFLSESEGLIAILTKEFSRETKIQIYEAGDRFSLFAADAYRLLSISDPPHPIQIPSSGSTPSVTSLSLFCSSASQSASCLTTVNDHPHLAVAESDVHGRRSLCTDLRDPRLQSSSRAAAPGGC